MKNNIINLRIFIIFVKCKRMEEEDGDDDDKEEDEEENGEKTVSFLVQDLIGRIYNYIQSQSLKIFILFSLLHINNIIITNKMNY